MKKIIYIVFLLVSITCPAQFNRAGQATNIANNIYENNTHKITGEILQSVMLNQNNSYANLLSDTNYFDVRNFSPTMNYTPGMGAFHGDTLYLNVHAQTGAWNMANWMFVASGTGSISGSGTSPDLAYWDAAHGLTYAPNFQINQTGDVGSMQTSKSIYGPGGSVLNLAYPVNYYPVAYLGDDSGAGTGESIQLSRYGILFYSGGILSGEMVNNAVQLHTNGPESFSIVSYAGCQINLANGQVLSLEGDGSNARGGIISWGLPANPIENFTFYPPTRANGVTKDTALGWRDTSTKAVEPHSAQLATQAMLKTAIAGAGTVTSVGSGNLSPYFTSSVSNATTTPSITYTATTVPIHKALMGGTTNQSTAVPTFRTIYGSDLPTTIDTNFGANLTATQIPYAVSTSSVTTSSNLSWNNNHGSLNIGNPAQQSNAGIISSGYSKTYYQYVFQNTNSGHIGSTDLILYNDLANTIPADTAIDFVDVFYNSSTNIDSLFTAACQNQGGLFNNNGALWLGAHDSLGFFVGGTQKINRQGYFTTGGLALATPLSASSGGTGLTTGAWGLSGNTIISSNYIGSNNNQPVNFRQNGRSSGTISISGIRSTILGYNGDTVLGATNDVSGFGYEVLFNNKGARNTAFGSMAGFHNTTGIDNTFNGYDAGLACSTGDSNTYQGSGASANNQTSNGNVAVGFNSGRAALGRDNTFVGALSGEAANTYNYVTALGYGALATANYQMVFGASNNSHNLFWGDMNFNGSTGTSGQILVSNGNANSPGWVSSANAFDTIQYYTPTTGTTISANNSLLALNQLIASPSGTLVALTINFPTNPANRQQFSISITQIITTLTLSGGSNTIDGTITTSSINSFGTWIYYSATTTWYKRG